jgi:hypothetical protein
MRWIRPRLARVAAAWLLFHATLLLSVPTAVCSMRTVAVASVAPEKCACGHSNAQACPLHEKSKASADRHSCACRNASDPLTALAASIVGPAAVLAPSIPIVTPLTRIAWLHAAAVEPLDSFSVPASPPPRG